MTDTQQLFLVHRRLKLRGSVYEPGDVVDLAPMSLPQGRVQQLVDQRRGELVTSTGKLAAPDTAQQLIQSWAVSGGEPETTDTDDTAGELAVVDGLSQPLPNGGIPAAHDLQRLSVPQLRQMARTAGVPIRGSKAEIITRLTGAAKPS